MKNNINFEKSNLYKMNPIFSLEKTFQKINFSLHPIPKGEYELCSFINCDFSNTDLSSMVFVSCEFVACNLSLVPINDTSFREVNFKDCKMLGLRFDTCHTFGLAMNFINCNLNHSSFYKIKLKKSTLKDCQLQETDFTECDLTASKIENCNFLNASFDRTILEKADLRTSYNYLINPEQNHIKRAKFSLSGVSGLLVKYDIEIDSNQ
jgi:uncharacterized protein YjbI with pentapeptide repeats